MSKNYQHVINIKTIAACSGSCNGAVGLSSALCLCMAFYPSVSDMTRRRSIGSSAGQPGVAVHPSWAEKKNPNGTTTRGMRS